MGRISSASAHHSVAVAGGYFGGGAAVAVALIGAQVLYKFAEEGGMNAIGRLREPGGHIIQVTRQHLKLTTIGVGSDGGLALDIEHGERRSTHFEGMHARRAATTLFPMVNHRGGTADDVQLALKRLIHAGSAERFLGNLARRGAQLPTGRSEPDYGSFETRLNAVGDTGLLALPTTLGLAIEMALHDEQERAALAVALRAPVGTTRELPGKLSCRPERSRGTCSSAVDPLVTRFMPRSEHRRTRIGQATRQSHRSRRS